MEKSKENPPSSSSMEKCDASSWIDVNDDEKFKVRGFKVLFLGEEVCVCEHINISTKFHLFNI